MRNHVMSTQYREEIEKRDKKWKCKKGKGRKRE
jgi:hypothetical protein